MYPVWKFHALALELVLLPVLLLTPLRAVEDLPARRALVPRRLLAHRAGTLVLVVFLDQPHLKNQSPKKC